MLAHIGISHHRAAPAELFDDFRRTVFDPRLETTVEARGSDIYAGLEWLMPTAVVAYIAKSYFDGFLKEVGKDHYRLLKIGLKKLGRRMRECRVTMIGSKGKVSAHPVYSRAYSIMVGGDGLTFKLLIQDGLSEEQQDDAIELFMTFADSFYEQSLDNET